MTTKPRNYSTEIPVSRTIGEIQHLLAEHGARSITVDYEERLAVAISCRIPTPAGERSFRLKAEITGTYLLLVEQQARRQVRPGLVTLEQAARICWRTIAEWLGAAVAMIAARAASLDQILFAYMLPEEGSQTMYEAYVSHEQKLLADAQSGGHP